jgi:hypothetical protein
MKTKWLGEGFAGRLAGATEVNEGVTFVALRGTVLARK